VRRQRRRVCLLTGASGRLGVAFCRTFARRYDIVAVGGSRDVPFPTQSQRFVDPLDPDRDLPANRNPVHALRADLTDERELNRLVDVALARFGTIDLLVNAATDTTRSALLALDEGDDVLTRHFLVDATVPARLTALVARRAWLGRSDENRHFNRNVVNVSSITSLLAGSGGLGAYGAAKAALNYLSDQLAHELQPHAVRVNVLAPTSFPRLIPTNDVAREIAALDRSHATGTTVVLDEEGRTVL